MNRLLLGLLLSTAGATLLAACGDADKNAIVGARSGNGSGQDGTGTDPSSSGAPGSSGAPSGTSSGGPSSTDGGTSPSSLTCTSCHGDATRATVAGADPNLKVAPPKGTKGETAATTRAVGAHQTHLATGSLANPIACTECHVVPTTTNHSNGKVDMAFGTLAKTGGKTPVWDGTSCSASYCHGNFAGGNTAAAPVWTSAGLTCTSCHGAPPATGDHLRSQHQVACSACHGAGYSATTVNKALHVNGVKNAGGAGSMITYNAATRACTPTCHGTEIW